MLAQDRSLGKMLISSISGSDYESFATLSVILPSRYSGGIDSLVHAPQQYAFNHGERNTLDTAVIAW